MSLNYKSFKQIHLIMLLSVANFLAAFSNGAVLHYYPSGFFTTQNNRITDMFNNPLLPLVGGTLIGLAFIKLMPARWSQWASAWASIAAGVTSMLLFWFFSAHIQCKQSGSHAIDLHDWLFFPLICMRFGLSVASRSFRLDIAAGHKRRIGWVELAYSMGMILGLILWMEFTENKLQIFKIILCMDFVLLLTAGALDMFSSPSFLEHGVEKTPAEQQTRTMWHNSARYKAAVVVAVALTVGVQMVAFAFSKTAGDRAFSIVAGFYFGAAVASLIYGSYVKVELRWPRTLQGSKHFGIPEIGFGDGQRRYSLAWVCVLSITALMVAILVGWRFTLSLLVIVPLVGVAAFLLEMIALSLFKWVGDEAAKTQQKGLVAVMLGAMGVGGTISLYYLSIPLDSVGPSSSRYAGWAGTSVVCLIVAILTVPVATLLARPRSKDLRDRSEATEAVSLSSQTMQRPTSAGEAAVARGDV